MSCVGRGLCPFYPECVACDSPVIQAALTEAPTDPLPHVQAGLSAPERHTENCPNSVVPNLWPVECGCAHLYAELGRAGKVGT